jgi:protein-S-isoprenylcysteine O-methyltransferase Ste14
LSAQPSAVLPPSRRVSDSRRHFLLHALARLRVTLGFVFGAIVLALATPTPRSLVIGLSIAAVGEAIRVWAAGHLNKSREVTSSGPYRWVAHPLYVGSSVMGAGLAIACGNVPVAVLIAVYLVTTLTAAIKSEEAFLKRTFGEQYDLYRAGVDERRRAGTKQSRRFSMRQAMANREYRAVAGFLIAVLLLILKATYNGSFWGPAG